MPWRKTRDPYKIWVSEVMLQQTTAKAVVPYYRNFLKTFPSLRSLARAGEKQVYPLWAGLGYYQRAGNMIRAAKKIKQLGSFPKSYRQLTRLPGFGPYTARAVSSLSFEEPVGVLDGNVIRFLSRFHGCSVEWWTTKGRATLQSLADKWVKNQKSSQMNQALMEIGSLICCSPAPFCRLCPLSVNCLSFKKQQTEKLPLKRLKKAQNPFQWTPVVMRRKNGLFAFVKNESLLPFLKNRPVFPGRFQKVRSRPASYHFAHQITHHKIYVTVKRMAFDRDLQKKVQQAGKPTATLTWLDKETIKQKNPSSLIQKVLDC